ncbi:hypothetical protein [Tenacibaculum sp. SZ-18]|uniref:hypothetical protein n=1 Tax=Tenacibaculum sp. SZ-18 TaxID=754423 RepID=UPI0012FDB18D|nr:hypothetical protein [Tenacibaculum sp. SZ-18]
MKKSVFFGILFLSSLCYAQNGFIEVEVKDTIRSKVLKYEYSLEILNTTNEVNFVQTGSKTKKERINEKKNELKEKIEDILKKGKYIYRKPVNYNSLVNSYNFSDKAFIITIKNKQELQRTYNLFKDFEDVNISLEETFFKDDKDSEKRLFKKLLQKAKNKALMIAELSDLKLGKVQEVKEVKEIDNLSFNIMDFYINTNMNKSSSKSFFTNQSKAIVVKFIAE